MMHYDRKRYLAQTFVFFLVSFSTVFLICGLGLDLGLWYLDRLRLSRACDAAVITGVANLGKGDTDAGRKTVVHKMATVAMANYYALRNINTNPIPTPTTSSNPLGGIDYTYNLNSGTNSSTMAFTLQTGDNGRITMARMSATTKTHTAFMGYVGLNLLSTLGSAEAQVRPRLIVLVLDRSGSMRSNGGASILPGAVTNFLSMFKDDPANNTVGIVSFSSFARVEMPLTTNFWRAGTNKMWGATPATENQNPTGMKFDGYTCADEGFRTAYEIMRTNEGWTNPQTVKFIVFFSDGEFNTARMLLAAPTWTNAVYVPPTNATFTLTSGNTIRDTNNFPAAPFNASSPRYAMATAAIPADEGFYADGTVKNGSRFYTNFNVTLQPGMINITLRNNGTREVRYSQEDPISFIVRLDQKETNMVIAPGYMVDANVYRTGSLPNSPAGTLSTYISRSSFIMHKPEDNGTNNLLGKYYPDGTIYSNVSSSSGSAYTNFTESDSYMAGELFFAATGSTTQEMKTAYQWTNGVPTWVTNNYMNPWLSIDPWWITDTGYREPLSNSITAGGSARFFARTFRGDPRPTNWVMEANVIPRNQTNRTPGVIIRSGGLVTNINSFSWNGAPTHYFDYRTGMWTNFTNWNVAQTEYCNWKVSTYCDQARQQGVFIYTVGFDNADPNLMGRMANDPLSYAQANPAQTQGKFYECTSAAQIATYFQEIAQQILAFLSK